VARVASPVVAVASSFFLLVIHAASLAFSATLFWASLIHFWMVHVTVAKYGSMLFRSA
jgi:hypothetical protein